jgi:predicted kinase
LYERRDLAFLLKVEMGRPCLIIVCGIPGAGKSTFALRAADRWEAVRFASETFAEELGTAARTASGDLSKEAIVHAYAAMGAAVTSSLATNRLVIAVGSFRSEELRSRFRAIAKNAGANVTTLRVVCTAETAAERIRARLVFGERGPTQETLFQISAELDQASDIEIVLTNNLSLECFYQKVDAVMHILDWGSENEASTAEMMRRLEQLGMDGVGFADKFLGAKSQSKRFDRIIGPRA